MMLRNVRLAFPQLFTPSAFDDNQEPRYQATLLIPNGDPQIEKLHAEALAVAQGKWGAKWDTIKGMVTRRYLRDGSEKPAYDGFQGHVFVSANNKKRPTVIDRDRSPLVAQDGKPYGGCFVNASVEIWAQDNKYGKALNASLLGVQFVRDGDSFGGSRVADASEFDDLSEAEEPTAVDPLA